MKVIGSVSSYASAFVTFTVNVTQGNCTTTVVNIQGGIAAKTYTIGGSALSFAFTEWTEDFGQCGPFTYTAAYTNGTALNPNLINFTASSKTFNIH